MRSFLYASAVAGVAAVALMTGDRARAHEFPCDFLTGGGFILTTASGTHAEDKANEDGAKHHRTMLDRRLPISCDVHHSMDVAGASEPSLSIISNN